jgi:hypothetical protein
MFGFPHEFKRNMTNKITNRLLCNLMARVLDVYGHSVCHTIQCTLLVSACVFENMNIGVI